MYKILAVAAAVLVSALPLKAEIRLTLDTAAKEFWFSGSATGLPVETQPSIGVSPWSYQVTTSVDFFDVDSAFSTDFGTIIQGRLTVFEEGAGFLIVIAYPEGTLPPSVTFTADDSIRFSYADRLGSFEAAFEQLGVDQQTLAPEAPTGYSDVAMNAVPEPSSFMLLGLGALALGLFARRTRLAR